MSLGPVMIGISGCELNAEEREMLLHPLVGGVILFTRNYESPAQITSLTDEIHALRDPHLLIAVDHEGGRVQRFRSGFSDLPAVRHLGAIYERNSKQARVLAELSGWLMAVELRSVGVDFSFAPVLDIDMGFSQVIGDRAFHKNPEIIADLAHAYHIGMHRAGMAGTGKHFPGHGGVMEDSHHALPVDHRPYKDIMVDDLLPFERMIHLGLEAVMVAHVIYDQVDNKLAGFSTFWLQEVLRKRLGFQGVIFSDDLEMAAANIVGGVADRAQCALEAGCDMVIICQTPDAMAEVLDGVKEWKNPVSQLRLVRMHGKKPVTRQQLSENPAWKAAISQVEGYNEPHTLDLV